ncbi:Uncharacterized protein TCM_035777 [Theobroma cacao]|uniref:Uncharacterized protein n=1 Tax=Theobroma cacao TaxID=3641 RepID=A0A061FJK2_THECC|nr:Uncharacterized protein TCM_035777 [Theobroma cacao]
MRNMKRKEGALAIKINLEKVYDRVKWSFSQEVLIDIGFPSQSINLIMFIVKSFTFFIIWNGNHTLVFTSTRCLHQGDPLSIYLFV